MDLEKKSVPDEAQKRQRKSRAKLAADIALPSRPSISPVLVALQGGKTPKSDSPHDGRNAAIERAISGVKSALKAGVSRVVRPPRDNETAVRLETREIYFREEIQVRMRFRALQLADAFFEQCMRDMAKPRQLHYHMTGDNCVEMWMPSSGASSAIASMTSAAKMLLGMAEHATLAEKNHIEALRAVEKLT
jgi:hypothetical protein